MAVREHALMVSLSAETTKVHMIDQVFFAVARQIDWDQVAVAIVNTAYDNIAVPAAPGRLTVAEVAADHDLDPRELYRSVRRALEHLLLTDTSFPRELRRALLRLAQAHLGSGDVNTAEALVIHGWLTGERVGLRELRDAMIYARIGRHNARTMLTSVGRLLLRAGYGGLVLHCDLTRLAEARRPPVPERTGIYYSKAAVLDAYELLRQLIDATDDLTGMLVLAVVPPELVSDEGLQPWSVSEVWLMAHEGSGHFVDVTDTFDRKVAALRAHQSQTSHLGDELETMLRSWSTTMAATAGWPEGRLAEARSRANLADRELDRRQRDR